MEGVPVALRDTTGLQLIPENGLDDTSMLFVLKRGILSLSPISILASKYTTNPMRLQYFILVLVRRAMLWSTMWFGYQNDHSWTLSPISMVNDIWLSLISEPPIWYQTKEGGFQHHVSDIKSLEVNVCVPWALTRRQTHKHGYGNEKDTDKDKAQIWPRTYLKEKTVIQISDCSNIGF